MPLKYGALAHLGEADEGQRPEKVDAPGETGDLCDCSPRAAFQIDLSQASFAGF
jgi:hypothetical protein